MLYVDTSALVKLVIAEPESPALRVRLERGGPLVSSALVSAELVRATRRVQPELEAQAMRILRSLHLFAIDENLLTVAAHISPPVMRTLDAIHVATAIALGPDVDAMVTYDRRMADAAEGHGLHVEAPA